MSAGRRRTWAERRPGRSRYVVFPCAVVLIGVIGIVNVVATMVFSWVERRAPARRVPAGATSIRRYATVPGLHAILTTWQPWRFAVQRVSSSASALVRSASLPTRTPSVLWEEVQVARADPSSGRLRADHDHHPRRPRSLHNVMVPGTPFHAAGGGSAAARLWAGSVLSRAASTLAQSARIPAVSPSKSTTLVFGPGGSGPVRVLAYNPRNLSRW